MLNLPNIGDEVLDPNEKFSDLKGINKFDLLLCDGSVLDKNTHPQLWKVAEDPWDLLRVSLPVTKASQYPAANSNDGLVCYYVAPSHLYRSDDGGHTFTQKAALPSYSSNYEGLCCNADGSVVYCATGPTFVYSVDFGETWAGSLPALPASWSEGMCCSDDGNVLLVVNHLNHKGFLSKSRGEWVELSKGTGVDFGVLVDCNSDGTTLYTVSGSGASTEILELAIDLVTNSATLNRAHLLGYTSLGISYSGDRWLVVDVGQTIATATEDFFVTQRQLGTSQEVGYNSFVCGVEGIRRKYFWVLPSVLIDQEGLRHLPNLPPLDPRVPYRIVADLTENT